jgi:hypothetical protein
MLIVETIRKIRCAYERDKKSIRQIAIDFRLARNTVKKILRTGITDQQYIRKEQPLPKLGCGSAFKFDPASASGLTHHLK